MHVDKRRAQQDRHHNRDITVRVGLAVFLCAVLAGLADVSPAPASEIDPSSFALALETVKPGREGLELSARLANESGPLTANVNWSIRMEDGTPIYSGVTPVADIVTPPGNYTVDLRYGATQLSRTVSLLDGIRLKVNFVLNTGGLRVMPRAGGAMLPPSGARIKVFTLGGEQDGRFMAASTTPGELIPLPEGRYRVESRVGGSNALAVADVQVKAGHMTTVDVSYKVGLARLSFVGSPDAQVRWEVKDWRGSPIANRHGLTANVVLSPGAYTARAEVAGELLTATFSIVAGQSRDILLGN